MKLCYDCRDRLDGVECSNHRRAIYGETCDRCRRVETDNPVPVSSEAT